MPGTKRKLLVIHSQVCFYLLEMYATFGRVFYVYAMHVDVICAENNSKVELITFT